MTCPNSDFCKPLAIDSPITAERDARYIAGGNFFGTETVGFPPREPLAVDSLPDAGTSAMDVDGPTMGEGQKIPVIKLPNKSSKSKGKSKSPQQAQPPPIKCLSTVTLLDPITILRRWPP